MVYINISNNFYETANSELRF